MKVKQVLDKLLVVLNVFNLYLLQYVNVDFAVDTEDQVLHVPFARNEADVVVGAAGVN